MGKRSRPRRWLVRIAVLVVAVGTAVTLGVIALAALDALDAYRSLRAARSGLLAADRTEVVERRLAEARSGFGGASERLRSPLLAPARVVPLVGRQIRAFDKLATGAGEIADIGADAVDQLPSLGGKLTPARRIAIAREIAPVAQRLSRRLARVDVGDDSWLVTPLAAQHRRFSKDLAALRSLVDRTAVVAKHIAPFLEGPRTYLVLAANNAEMRAGHGMFLSAGTLTVSDGRFDLGTMESTATMRLEKDAVPLSGDLDALWGSLDPNREWRNLGVSPRFDVSAALASRMWKARSGEDVDGVIGLDALALRALLRATGPVEVRDEKISEKNVVKHVLHDQYLGVPATSLGKAERREALAELASDAMDAFDRGGWSPAGLLPGLADAAAGRHLLAWSDRDGDAEMWDAAGVTGALDEDSLLVAVLNRAGNKLDQFLDVDADLEIGAGEGGRQAATLRVRLRNRTPDGEPGYIAGPHPLLEGKRGEYVGILAVSLPGAARDARIRGVDELTPGGRDGPTVVVGAPVALRQGRSGTYEIRFTLPGSQRALEILPSGRVPAVSWTFGDERWRDTERRTVAW